MELRQIRSFMAVAEERHFGRAAERISIAQPALSQHIRRLERKLEAQLLDRSTRQVRLTPAGEAFVEVARRVLRQADQATVAARQAEAGETGMLEDQLVVALPAAHRLARQETVALASLRGERFVTLTRRSSMSLHDRFIEQCGAAGFNPEIAVEVEDPELLPMAVAAGLGVGIAASASVTGRVLPGLVWRPLADGRATVPLVLRRPARFLPMTTVADAGSAPRALQRAG